MGSQSEVAGFIVLRVEVVGCYRFSSQNHSNPEKQVILMNVL